jgi:hypothetical protein
MFVLGVAGRLRGIAARHAERHCAPRWRERQQAASQPAEVPIDTSITGTAETDPT